jgi:hypothetical protein
MPAIVEQIVRVTLKSTIDGMWRESPLHPPFRSFEN